VDKGPHGSEEWEKDSGEATGAYTAICEGTECNLISYRIMAESRDNAGREFNLCRKD